MDKIEKIRQEIERRIKIQDDWIEKGLQGGDLAFAVRVELKQLLSFLDTLSEEPNKSLEEAAEIIAKNILGRDYLAELDEDCAIDALEDAKNFVKAGAEWQKQQMLKDAIKATVTTNLADRPIIYLDQLHGFEYGDKVRIIILKEWEE